MTSPTPQPVTTDAPSSTETAYTLWCVLRRDPHRPVDVTEDGVTELEVLLAALAREGVTTRGLYDVSALRADADVMIWLHGARVDALQAAVRRLRRTSLLSRLLPTWNAMGVHRDAEFTASHLPSFLRGKEPAGWVTVYPFVRSHEWYLLPEDERREMLSQHGRRGSQHRSVLSNTVAAFALGDYEWILALEDDDPANLVDLMRDLRYTDARRHVRVETPFFTGRRIGPAELAEVLA